MKEAQLSRIAGTPLKYRALIQLPEQNQLMIVSEIQSLNEIHTLQKHRES